MARHDFSRTSRNYLAGSLWFAITVLSPTFHDRAGKLRRRRGVEMVCRAGEETRCKSSCVIVMKTELGMEVVLTESGPFSHIVCLHYVLFVFCILNYSP